MDFLFIIDLMSKGSIPTRRLAQCPDCGGLVTIIAVEDRRDNATVNISMSCYDCKNGVEISRHSKWKGWENLKGSANFW